MKKLSRISPAAQVIKTFTRWTSVVFIGCILGLARPVASGEAQGAEGEAKGEHKPAAEGGTEAKSEAKGKSEHKGESKPLSAAPARRPVQSVAVSELSAQRGACLADASAIEDIKKAKEEIEAKKKELTTKESDLKLREQALNEEIKKLIKARDDLAGAQDIKKKVDEEKLNKLVETLLSMSPKASSKVLSAVDEDLAVAAIYRMDTVRLGKILNVMDIPVSSKLSELMVGLVKKDKTTTKDRTQERAPTGMSPASAPGSLPANSPQSLPANGSGNPAPSLSPNSLNSTPAPLPLAPRGKQRPQIEASSQPNNPNNPNNNETMKTEKGGELKNDRQNESPTGANTAGLQQQRTQLEQPEYASAKSDQQPRTATTARQ